MLPAALCAAAASPIPDGLVAGMVIAAAIVVLIVVGAVRRDQRDRSTAREHQERMASEQRAQATAEAARNEKDERVYRQHVSLNDLTSRKLELEAKLMQAQAENIEHDRRVREQNEEYHRLMVQKAQLEIQSLKLHIREQQKRNEDFTSYDDE